MTHEESITWRGKVVRRANRLLRRLDIQVVRARSAEEYLLRGYQDVRRDEFEFRCDPHHRPFWTAFQNDQWESETFAILRQFLTRESVYYDIGAWIGPTVLYAAKLSRAVFAFEPDPVAYAYLLENITKNRLTNVRAYNLAVAATERTASLQSAGAELGDSMSSLVHGARAGDSWPVTTVTLDTLVRRLSCGVPDFVKIDIEGGEFELIPAIRGYLEQWCPVVYLSLHAPLLPSDERQDQLQKLAAALDFYACAIDQYDDWRQNGRADFALDTLPRSSFLDTFGSLLLLPERIHTRA